MPSPEDILTGLETIAREWRWLAVLWHAYLAAGMLALVVGFRPSRRLAGAFLIAPLLSVAALAWFQGNPFNGSVFTLSALILGILAVRLPPEPVAPAARGWILAGAALVAFGWFYPHFLGAASWCSYLYAAPTGLIPCPTLAVVTGLSLALGGLGSRSWYLTLAALGLFYGIFGAMRLGVRIDWVLSAGGVTALGAGLMMRTTPGKAAITGRVS